MAGQSGRHKATLSLSHICSDPTLSGHLGDRATCSMALSSLVLRTLLPAEVDHVAHADCRRLLMSSFPSSFESDRKLERTPSWILYLNQPPGSTTRLLLEQLPFEVCPNVGPDSLHICASPPFFCFRLSSPHRDDKERIRSKP